MLEDEKQLASGPVGNPMVGVLPELRRDPVGLLDRCHREYGGIVRYPVGKRHIYSINDPELVEEVMVKRWSLFTKGQRKRGKPFGLQLILGDGLLTNLDHDSWLIHRRMMQPMFHRRNLEAMADQMVAAGERMLRRWRDLPDGVIFILEEEMMTVALEVVTRTMFSAAAPEITGGIRAAALGAMDYVISREARLIKLPLSFPTPAQRRYRHAMSTLDGIVYGFIEERRSSKERHDDLLDTLLAAQDEETGLRMSDRQVRDEASTILGAGYETTANMLTWTWHGLNQNPEALARLQAEVDEVLSGRLPGPIDLPNLPYTVAVLEEALRHYPPLPILPRTAMEDVELGGYHIPANSLVLIAVHSVHHDPQWWESPQAFIPERFLSEIPESRHRLAYIPFGAGPRLCIGNRFALMEGTILLAMMAGNVDLRQINTGPVEKHTSITMRPVGGLPVKLHHRRLAVPLRGKAV